MGYITVYLKQSLQFSETGDGVIGYSNIIKSVEKLYKIKFYLICASTRCNILIKKCRNTPLGVLN